MTRLDRLRLLARYNVLTPIALLAAAALAQPSLAATVIINTPVNRGVAIPNGDSLVNNSDISAAGDAVSAAGSVGTITNASGAGIESTAGHAVFVGGAVTAFTNEAGADIWGDLHGVYFVAGNVDAFSNAGSIYGNSESAVSLLSAGSFVNSGDLVGNGGVDFGGPVDSFRNEAGGLIDGTTSFGASLGGPVSEFYNAGTITGASGVVVWNGVTSFTNDQTGVINAVVGFGVEVYGVVTSFSNLGLIESNLTGVFFDTDVGSFANYGTITGTTGVNIGGTLTSFRNEAGGLITGSDLYAVTFLSPVGVFYNTGTILGGSEAALGFDYASAPVDSFTNAGILSAMRGVTFGDVVDTFRNEGGALIEGTGDEAVSFEMSVGDFYNAGTIAGSSKGVFVDSTIGSFLNDIGGVISAWESFGEGVIVYGEVGAFTNLGQIGGGETGVYFDEHVDTFANAGAISGNDVGVHFNSDVTSFTNAAGGNIAGVWSGVYIDSTIDSFLNDVGGVITASSPGGDGLLVEGEVGSFSNRGLIEGGSYGAAFDDRVQSFLNTGNILGDDTGVYFDADVERAVNAAGGSITSQSGAGVYFGGIGSYVLENAGTISGPTGVQSDAWQTGSTQVSNSGTIEGTGGTAIDFAFGGTQPRDDSLTILTGSRIIGDIDFGAGDDKLDFSGFVGSTLLEVASLENVEAGNVNYVWDQPNEQIAIFDLTGSTSIGTALNDVAGALRGVIGNQSDDEEEGPLAYAPASRQSPAALAAESAVLSELEVGGSVGNKAWASVFGGGSSDDAPVRATNRFGGVVAGVHAGLGGGDLGLLAGYVRGDYNVAAGAAERRHQYGRVRPLRSDRPRDRRSQLLRAWRPQCP